MSRLNAKLATIAILSPAEVRDQWRAEGRGEVPALPIDILRRMLAHAAQEMALGRLPAARLRELRAVAAGEAPLAKPVSRPGGGARLIREWQGRTIVVEVEEDGFRYEGERYRSLSHIARAVTGAHWSGPRFFGVTGRG